LSTPPFAMVFGPFCQGFAAGLLNESPAMRSSVALVTRKYPALSVRVLEKEPPSMERRFVIESPSP
jgi:hypothetical protein